MTVWYSNHFGADGDNDIALQLPKDKIPASAAGARLYQKQAYFKGMPLIADVVRMMSFRSGVKIQSINLATDSVSAAGAVDVGIYLAGNAHDGAVVNAALFATAIDIGSAPLGNAEAFSEAGGAAFGINRGKTFWEILGLSADPSLIYDIAMTVTTSFTTADSIIIMTATYTAGN